MSRILRRPMFRGGQVIDSRGTGITSGLMDGGRVGYQNAGFVTGGQLMAAAQTFPELNMFKNIKLNPKSNFRVGAGNTINGFDVDKVASYIGGEGDLAFGDTYDLSASLTGGKKDDENIKIASADIENLKIGKKDDDIDFDKSFDIESIKSEDTYKPPKEGSTADIKEKEFSGEIDTTPTIITDEKDEEPKIEDPDQDIKNMADRYFELMGGGKAFSRDVGDMLLRFAAADGETVGDKFKDYLKAESKAGPSRTEKLKDASAKIAINYQTQKEFLEKKLASSESIAEKNIIAQQLRDLNKKYAPGITEKNVKFLTNLKKGTAEHTAALKQSGFGFNIFQEAKKAAADFEVGKLTAQDINSLGPIYYDDWGGIFKQGETEKDGTYLFEEAQVIVKIKDGKEVGRQKIDMQ
jgi:hypothetical protein